MILQVVLLIMPQIMLQIILEIVLQIIMLQTDQTRATTVSDPPHATCASERRLVGEGGA